MRTSQCSLRDRKGTVSSAAMPGAAGRAAEEHRVVVDALPPRHGCLQGVGANIVNIKGFVEEKEIKPARSP